MADDSPTGDPFTLDFDPALPITARRDELIETLATNQVVVVAGETGSGKSTQLPKLAWLAGRGRHGIIGHTQPRRIAARALASRIAEETHTVLGAEVGYSVRFDDHTDNRTRIRLMTDGILLAELARDPDLRRYDTLIVDEAHERSLNIDFLLGYLVELLKRRPDLHLIITSATIDTERFAAHFGDAPIVTVEGRSYPVDIHYRDIADDGVDEPTAIADAVEDLLIETPGDVLVFCTGEREIGDAVDAINARFRGEIDVLSLYSRLSSGEQQRIFEPHDRRRVVVSTNIAETSVTVPGVRSVVDTGTARVSRYSQRSRVQRLPIEAISQASANQRSGRCGRLGPGVCIRLYSQDDFDSRPEYTDPEILRTSLSAVILQMAHLGLGPVEDFAFLDPPDRRQIGEGIATLDELGAIHADRPVGTRKWLTPIGHQLSRIQVDPRIARMVVEAARRGVSDDVTAIGAFLSIVDPRERPVDRRDAAETAHRRFHTDGSDAMTILALWEYLNEQRRARSHGSFRRMCRAEFLHYARVREWLDLTAQLRRQTRDIGHEQRGRRRRGDRNRAPRRAAAVTGPGRADAVHRSMLSGLLANIGLYDDRNRRYRGARGSSFRLARGGAIGRQSPEWIAAAEVVETNDRWARHIIPVRAQWIEETAGDLVHFSYAKPEWDAARGSAVVSESALLFGLPLAANRRRQLARIDHDLARSYFLDHGLVRGEWPQALAVASDITDANHEVVDAVIARFARLRIPIPIDPDELLIDLYNERLPAEVTSLDQLRRWWNNPGTNTAALSITEDDLWEAMADHGAAVPGHGDDLWPDRWPYAPAAFPLTYLHLPGDDADGVTVSVGVDELATIGADTFAWNVPGHRAALIEALLRTMPKEQRRELAPLGETASAFAEAIDEPPAGAPEAEVVRLARLRRAPVRSGDVRRAAIPDHLQMRVEVIDSNGNHLDADRDVAGLLQRWAGATQQALQGLVDPATTRTSTVWTFGTIDRVLEQPGTAVRGFPALADEGECVGLIVCGSESEQTHTMWAGTRRLLRLGLPSPGAAMLRAMDTSARMALTRGPHTSVEAFVEDCCLAAVDAQLTEAGGPVWSESEFAGLAAAVRDGYARRVLAIGQTAGGVIDDFVEVRDMAAGLNKPRFRPARDDIFEQLDRLVYDGFVTGVGADRLDDLARYLRAIAERLSKLSANLERDEALMDRCRAIEAVVDRAAASGTDPLAVEDATWMCQELRVGLWAQRLGTAQRASEARILARLGLGPNGDG